MLVTFKTSAYSDITMFGSAAVSLLKLMGQSGNVPGAVMSADIPEALRTLHEGLAKMSDEEASGGSPSSPGAAAPVASTSRSQSYDEEDDAKPIALHTRAGPLISLLEAAAEAGESVQWDS